MLVYQQKGDASLKKLQVLWQNCFFKMATAM